MDIAAWLRELGLERYEQAFRENEIDAEILPKLTADDLKDIGVTTVGHRRKLLEAIAALAEPAVAPQAEPSAPAEAAPRARPAEAERRQLTVLFCRSGRLDRAGGAARSRGHGPGDPRLSGDAAPRWSSAGAGTSPSTWAMACSPISAGRRRTRTRPSGRCAPGLRADRDAVGVAWRRPRGRSRSRPGSASRPAWSWSAS